MKFHRTPSANDLLLEEVIGGVLRDLNGRPADQPEVATIIDQLTKLDAVRTPKDHVSKDALIGAAATLLSVLAIVGHERAHVVTSKAISLLKFK